jgi:SPP1 family predicted phage head-tail adaptor
MRAGRLRHRVTVQVPVRTKSGDFNATTVQWTDLYTSVAAGIEPARGRELEASNQRRGATDVRIVMRYLPDVTQACRIVDDATGDVYDIDGIVNENNRNRWLELQCTKGLTNG